TRKQTQELLGLTSAALALSADNMMRIHSLSDPDGELLDELVVEEQPAIQAATVDLALLTISEMSKPLGQGSATVQTMDFDLLVDLCHRHQTIQAARRVQTRVIDPTNMEKAKEASLRQQLILKFHLALKEEQDRAVGTGVEREVRWKASAPGGRGGNVRGSHILYLSSLQAATKRKEVFTNANVPRLPEVIAARVTPLQPLHIGNYRIIWTKKGLMVSHVFGLQAKGGGKHGKHEAVTESSNISTLSKISVQIFDNLHGTQFRSIPAATALLQAKQFGHTPPINFLCLLSAVLKLSPTGLKLVPEDSDRFRTLSRGLVQFNNAMTLFRKRGKKTAAVDGDPGEEEDEDTE
ncbi:hypothetical protein DFH07DRAFT_757091, partial [Mycena maculata]